MHLYAFLLLAFLYSIATATLLSPLDAEGVENASDNVIANTRQVANASTANQDNRMLLKIVVLSGNISVNFTTIGQADPGNLAQSRVGLLGRHGTDAKANAAALRTTLQVHAIPLRGNLTSCSSDALIRSGHKQYSVLDFAEGIGQGLVNGLFWDLNLDGLWGLSQVLYGHGHIGLERSAGRDEMPHDNIFL